MTSIIILEALKTSSSKVSKIIAPEEIVRNNPCHFEKLNEHSHAKRPKFQNEQTRQKASKSIVSPGNNYLQSLRANPFRFLLLQFYP